MYVCKYAYIWDGYFTTIPHGRDRGQKFYIIISGSCNVQKQGIGNAIWFFQVLIVYVCMYENYYLSLRGGGQLDFRKDIRRNRVEGNKRFTHSHRNRGKRVPVMFVVYVCMYVCMYDW